MQYGGRPEEASCGATEQLGVSGGGHNAAEEGVAVPEVIVQGRHLFGVFFGGEDLRGELSQLQKGTATVMAADSQGSFRD